MILQALTAHYEALAARGEIVREGWSRAKVAFALVLDADGALLDIMPTMQEKKGKDDKIVQVPVLMQVPQQIKKSVNIASNFLCEGPGYLLGLGEENKAARTRKCFDACKELHLRLLQGVDSPAARAVYAFFAHWDPDAARAHPVLQDHIDELLQAKGSLVFRFDSHFVQTDPTIIRAWDQRDAGKTPENMAQCLVTGEQAPIARLHPPIKGVRGAQSSGASLVSFNADAFVSFGKSQGENAPVGEHAAFAYTTALNTLLADSEHVKRMGDATVVYWAENAESGYQSFYDMALEPDASRTFTEDDLKSAMEALSKGRFYDFSGFTLDPDMPFYVLGISPNAARLSVRFFYQNDYGAFMKNLQAHYERLEIERPQYEKFEYLSVSSLLYETVNKKAKDKAASPLLAGALLRAILNDTPYPALLMNSVLLRIRADRNINRARAAILKAVLLKNSHNQTLKEAVKNVKLNEDTKYLPYVLGRVFALLEDIQTSAIEGLNSTIKDRYFTTACTTPASVFPQLLRLKMNHMKVLMRDQRGLAINLEKQLGQLLGRIDCTLPKHQTLDEQGAFILGYYHQVQKFYEKSSKGDDNNTTQDKENKENG